MGRLGDSIVAFDTTATQYPGKASVFIVQHIGMPAAATYFDVYVDLRPYTEGVSTLRLVRFSDQNRTPIWEVNAGGVKNSFVSQTIPSVDIMNTTWDVFNTGDGMVEMVPATGPIVRARMLIRSSQDYHDVCT